MTAGARQPRHRHRGRAPRRARSSLGRPGRRWPTCSAPTRAASCFGRSMTQLTFDLARTLRADWGPGDEVVVTRLDHDANIRPWVLAAERRRRDRALARLRPRDRRARRHRDRAVRPHPAGRGHRRLQPVRHPPRRRRRSPGRPRGRRAGLRRRRAPRRRTPRSTWRRSARTCWPARRTSSSARTSASLAASPALLETLRPDKLLPSTRRGAGAVRARHAALRAARRRDRRASTSSPTSTPADAADRRTRVLESMTAVEEYEDGLLDRLLDGLGSLDGVTLHGRPRPAYPDGALRRRRAHRPRGHEHLATRGVNAPASHFYASRRRDTPGSATRAPCAPASRRTPRDERRRPAGRGRLRASQFRQLGCLRAHRHLERQLAPLPHRPGGGVPAAPRHRRAGAAGDQGPRGPAAADGARSRWATRSRPPAPTSGTASRSSAGSASRTCRSASTGMPRLRRARRRRRRGRSARRAAASGSGRSTCPTAARSTTRTTSTSSTGSPGSVRPRSGWLGRGHRPGRRLEHRPPGRGRLRHGGSSPRPPT